MDLETADQPAAGPAWRHWAPRVATWTVLAVCLGFCVLFVRGLS